MNRKNYAIATVVIIGFAVVMIIKREASLRRSKDAVEKANVEFSAIEKSIELSDRIQELYCPPKIRCVGQAYLVLVSGKKVRIMAHGHEENLALTNLNSGDSIFKTRESDTIWIRSLRHSNPVFFMINGN